MRVLYLTVKTVRFKICSLKVAVSLEQYSDFKEHDLVFMTQLVN